MVVADDDSGIEAEIGAVVGAAAAAAGYDTAVAVDAVAVAVAAGDRDFVCKAKNLLQPLEVAGDDVS